MSTDAITPNLIPDMQSTAAATPFDDLDGIVATHQQRIFRFLLTSLREPDIAHTLTQETFLRAWSTRASFRGDCSIATWLTRIALNLLRDHTRTQRFRFWRRASASSVDATEIAAFLPHRDSPLESRLIASEQMTLIWQTVGSLSDRQRTVFLLRFVDEMELPEIAAATGLPLSTVKSHLYRALAAIRTRHAASTRKTP
ncbi:RNA polymerase sigma factor [Edaphobacter aggregans]|uniref:RNA polymerase sigma factor n=1 Tax=Edaphobacter aggregans TaxID=570835 RepID=UPI00054F0667|nr:sigma-70 family RNA polymerase sigma factor [Edaphobacter aggregans]